MMGGDGVVFGHKRRVNHEKVGRFGAQTGMSVLPELGRQGHSQRCA